MFLLKSGFGGLDFFVVLVANFLVWREPAAATALISCAEGAKRHRALLSFVLLCCVIGATGRRNRIVRQSRAPKALAQPLTVGSYCPCLNTGLAANCGMPCIPAALSAPHQPPGEGGRKAPGKGAPQGRRTPPRAERSAATPSRSKAKARAGAGGTRPGGGEARRAAERTSRRSKAKAGRQRQRHTGATAQRPPPPQPPQPPLGAALGGGEG